MPRTFSSSMPSMEMTWARRNPPCGPPEELPLELLDVEPLPEAPELEEDPDEPDAPLLELDVEPLDDVLEDPEELAPLLEEEPPPQLWFPYWLGFLPGAVAIPLLLPLEYCVPPPLHPPELEEDPLDEVELAPEELEVPPDDPELLPPLLFPTEMGRIYFPSGFSTCFEPSLPTTVMVLSPSVSRLMTRP